MNIGTRVVVTDLDTYVKEKYALLGAWDSDPEKGVISYLTPLAQSLIGHKVGEEVDFDSDGAKRRFRIEAIEAGTTA